ncbi:MAG: IclR family transcriptional regulator, partial [Lysobacteraceae bacterium]
MGGLLSQSAVSPAGIAGGAVIRSVPALTRGLAVLRLLSASDAPLGVHEVARALGLVPSTCLHILRVLTSERLIAFDPVSKKYVVAAGLLSLARSALRHNSFSVAVQPDLDALSAEYRATAVAVEANGLEHMVVVALAYSASPLQLQVEIGSRFPALISATGRCIAAFGDYSRAEIRSRFRRLKWDLPPTLAEWETEVQATRESGYAVDDGRYIRGVCIVAAPVSVPGKSISALVVIGVKEQLYEIGLTALGIDLRDRA